MDIADLIGNAEDQDRGKPLTIVHPVTGEPIPDIVFIIAGPDSDVQRRARLKASEELASAQRVSLGRIEAEKREEISIRLLARCIVGWEVKEGGKNVPFNSANVVRVLTASTVIREQVDAFASSRSAWWNNPSEKVETSTE